MIPRVIHYCWLSDDPYPELVERCLTSWKKNLTGYEFCRWDLTRAPKVPWVMEAYNQKKYAFAADYIRFYALYRFGGIYLDVDVEVLKTFDPLLINRSFIGYDINGYIEGAVIGAEPGMPWIKTCLDAYQDKHFIKDDGTLTMKTVPLLIADVLKSQFGVTTGRAEMNEAYDGINIFPFYFFSPKNAFTQHYAVNDETFCIHHFDGGWVKKTRWLAFKFYMHRLLVILFGQRGHNRFMRLMRRWITE